MLGFDRDHPVVNGGALDSAQIPRVLIGQRAWAEALMEFKAVHSPTARDIEPLLRQGLTMQEVAEKLGIGFSTVYKILSRGRRQRGRQYLG